MSKCDERSGPMQVESICPACWELAEAEADKAESGLREARRERDEHASAASILREANANLLAELRAANERAEKAEAERVRTLVERDKARRQAVWAKCGPYDRVGPACWWVVCPGGRVLGEYGWGKGFSRSFYTEAEALVAGRAVPWWEAGQ